MILSRFKKAAAFTAACVLSFTVMNNCYVPATADSVSELELEIEANRQAIENKRARMDELSEQSADAKEYIRTLDEQMKLRENNIAIINVQISNLNCDISKNEAEIAVLEEKIAEKKTEIDADIEVFRERLRSMYISGNDSMAGILTGATDFYDLLARYELISRVAENDDELIDSLNIELDDFNRQNDELTARKEELSRQKSEAEAKRDKLQGEMNALIDEYYESQETLAQITADEQLEESDIMWLNSRNSELEGRIESIKEQERIAAEEARRAAEQRRREQREREEREQREREEQERREREEQERREREEQEQREREEQERREAEEQQQSYEEEQYYSEETALETTETYSDFEDWDNESYGYNDYDYDYGYDDYGISDDYYDDDYEEDYDDYEEDYYTPVVDTSYEAYSGSRDDIVDYAKTYLGIYYQWCGNYPANGNYGLDCSHFTYRVLEHFGLMDYYMDSRGQCSYCTPISYDELMPGDLVFYQNGSGRVEHVTMYIGNGQIIGAQGGDSWVNTESEAESINAKVKIVSLDSDRRYKTYGRVPGMY